MESSPLAQDVDPLQPQWRYQVDARTEPRPSGSLITYRVAQTVYLLVGVVEALIITRVALKLLAANSGVGFVRFVYGVSSPLVTPFRGIFPTPVSNTNVLELSSLLAIAIYGLIAWAIVRMIAILGRRPLPRTAG
jgi:uncharacterized protein YggT (Ycf19 family)